MDFPASLDADASVPQESLKLVSQAIDDIGSSIWKSTAEIINHDKDKLFVVVTAGSNSDSDSNNDRQLSSSSQVGFGFVFGLGFSKDGLLGLCLYSY